MEKIVGSLKRKLGTPTAVAKPHDDNGTRVTETGALDTIRRSPGQTDGLEAYRKLMQSMENDIREVLVSTPPSPKIARIEKIEIDAQGNEEVRSVSQLETCTSSSQMTMWTPEMVYLLIDLYPKFHEQLETSARKKDIWKCIAQQMYNEGGFQVEGERCREKWKNMLGHYRRVCVRKHSDVKTNRKRDTQPFYVEQLAEALHKTGQAMNRFGSVVPIASLDSPSSLYEAPIKAECHQLPDSRSPSVKGTPKMNGNDSSPPLNGESVNGGGSANGRCLSPRQIVAESIEAFRDNYNMLHRNGLLSQASSFMNVCSNREGTGSAAADLPDSCAQHCAQFQRLLQLILETLKTMKDNQTMLLHRIEARENEKLLEMQKITKLLQCIIQDRSS